MKDTPNKLSSNEKKDEAIQNILEFLPESVEVPVLPPTQNRWYTLTESSKPVTVRPLTYEDEKIAAKARASGGDLLTIMLDRCVDNINVNDLFLFDKLYFLLKLREATYGPSFESEITCNKCEKNSKVSFDLTTVNITQVPDDVTNPNTFTLPILKKEISIRFPRVRDEVYFTGENEDIGTNLWRFIESIDGHKDPYIISKVIEKMHVQDIHRIIAELGGDQWGIDPKVDFTCAECKTSYAINLPLSEDFFYLS